MGTRSAQPLNAEISRPRLAEQLNAAATGRLTVVAAGAGYGKTTLLRAWARSSSVSWHTLTVADHVPGALGAHLVDALRLRVPDLSADLMLAASRLRGHGTDDLTRAEAAAAALADALDGRLSRPVVLVLDDLDEIAEAPEAVRMIAALVRQAPPGLRLVVASRDVPPFRTNRLLAHGEATSFGPADLAFTGDETAELVQRRLGRDDPTLAEGIHVATSGWPVATRLAVEAAATNPDREAFLQTLREPAGLLLGYMVDEVMGRESPDVIELLSRTEPLDGFEPALARAVGVEKADRVVAAALRRGVFLEPHASEPGRLVLTPLCRAALPSASVLVGDERAKVIDAAASWHEDRGEYATALGYWTRLRDAEGCARMLEAHGADLLTAGQASLIVEAIAIIPPERRGSRLEMLGGDAWMLLGDWDSALAGYGRAAPGTGPAPAPVAWRTGLVHYMRGELDDAAKAFDEGDPDDSDLAARALLMAWSASVYWLRGDLEGCRKRAARALTDARRSRDHRALANAYTVNAMLAALDGDRDANDSLYLMALDHATSARDVLQLVRIHTNRSSHYLEEGDAQGALDEVDVAVRLADLAGFATFRAIALTNRGEALLALGRLDEARAELESARAGFERLGSSMAAYPCGSLGDLHRIRGDQTSAQAAYDRALALSEPVRDTQGLVPALTGLARLHLLDDPAKARAFAERALATGPSLFRLRALLTAAVVDVEDGAVELAAERAESALGQARAQRDRVGVAEAHEILGRARRDPVAAAAAVEGWTELGDPIGVARARLILAELDGSASTIELAAQSAEHARALGATGVANRVTAVLDELRHVAAPEVAITCMGGFTLSRDGAPVPGGAWKSRKARDILKVLVCRGRRSMTREQLADLMWPDDDPALTGNRLSVALSTVRAVLDPDRRRPADYYLRADGDAISIDNSHVDVDIERFLDHARRGLTLVRTGPLSEARRHLEEAEILYTGDVFEDDPYEEWAVDLREKARLTYLDIARMLADLAARDRDDAARARYLLRILERDPFDERAHLDLVRLFASEGRHGEARRRYRIYGRRMEEIDVEAAPYPATRQH
ncbi:MAG TPA: BTAD domain-containing putative transcriptional regulator [Jiangellaceae bacterium]